jgi:calcineurin-like phosphoesterase family protein
MPLQLALDTWLISDCHFGHGNIVDYAGRPERHNEIMLDNWWQLVKPTDTVLCLGDVCMTSNKIQDLYRQIRELPGDKYLKRGNHDTNSHKWYEEKLGFQTLRDIARPSRSKNAMQGGITYTMFDRKRIALSHVPDGTVLDWDINIHGHIHTNGYTPSMYESGRDYRNICVEVVGYRPHRLADVLTNPACYQTPRQSGPHNSDKRLIHL